jgi:hypothetical protein
VPDREHERQLDGLVRDDGRVRLGVGRLEALERIAVLLGLLGDRHPALERVEAGVGRDPVQPRTDRGLAAETGPPAPRPQEGLLDEVLRVFVRAHHLSAVCLQLAPVALGKRRELDIVGDQVRIRHRRRPYGRAPASASGSSLIRVPDL